MSTDDLIAKYGKYMELKVFVDSQNEDLHEKYKHAVEKHNQSILSSCLEKHHQNVLTMPFFDAGFDLFNPADIEVCREDTIFYSPLKMDFQLKCSATMVSQDRVCPTGYYMYPRSSLSKTRLRLANSVGIIDSGYRGNLMGMFDFIIHGLDMDADGFRRYTCKALERYVQICGPELNPIYVVLVSSVEELGDKTQRGSGGFGSTGL